MLLSEFLDCRSFLDEKSDNSTPIYGVNTGFGSLCNKSISKEDLEELQVNLVISHACGFGEEVPSSIVKLMLLFKSSVFIVWSFGSSVKNCQQTN